MRRFIVCLVTACSLLLANCGGQDEQIYQQEPEGEETQELGSQGGTGAPVSTHEQTPKAKPADSTPDTAPSGNEPTGNVPSGNEPSGSVPVSGTAQMLINELRTEYHNTPSGPEFIEFKVKEAGNLYGVKLYLMADADEPFIYDFPAIEVQTGEYITLHLRILDEECIDELGQDLTQSGGKDSEPTARDLWFPGNKKLLYNTDIVYLQAADGRILDAVFMNESLNSQLLPAAQQHFNAILEFLFNKGAWKSVFGSLPGPADSVNTSTIKTGSTKSVNRREKQEDTNTANDWYASDANGKSPGQPNKE